MADKTATGGLSLCSALTILFVALKLCDKIGWSWWWVVSPLWLPWAAAFAVGGLIMIFAVGYNIFQRLKK